MSTKAMETDENKQEEEEEEDDRVMKEVVAPPRFPLAHDKLFQKDGKIDLKCLVEHLNKEGRLELNDAISVVRKASALYKKEPNLLKLKDPLTVCGDVHGQFFDLLRLLEAGGDPTNTQYLFLGDYVDRGCFSCEVVLYLYSFKISFPKTFYMIRGNHECRHLTSFFNFKDECLFKYNEQLYDEIMESFDNLPIAATINNKFLCMHGGLSPDISTLDDIAQIDRFQEIPREGPFCDLLWADPVNTKGENDSDSDEDDGYEPQPDTKWFAYNDTRQCSYVFGIEAVDAFLKRNKLTAIIRAHEAQSQGYKMQMINEATNIPRVITIFSAPNYCDVYGNKAACLKFDNDLLNIRQFVFSPHPYYLPNFMDVFSWSLPFVAEKVTDMLAHVVNWSEEYPDEDDNKDTSQIKEREHILRDKVKAISRMLKMYKTLRENTDLVVQLKQLTPNKALPTGVLAGGREGIEKAITSFKEAKKADKPNERFPDMGEKPTKLKKDIVF